METDRDLDDFAAKRAALALCDSSAALFVSDDELQVMKPLRYKQIMLSKQ